METSDATAHDKPQISLWNHSIPKGWRIVRLSDLFSRVTRKIAHPDLPVLTISAKVGFMAQEERYSRFMAGESLKRYIELHRYEFAYNKGNSQTFPHGCVYPLRNYEKAAVPHVYFCFKSRIEIDEDFFAHYFASGALNEQLARINNTGVRSNGLLNIRAEQFFAMEIPLPPLDEQRKISAILGSADNAIESARSAIDQTGRVKHGLMHELLTRGIGHTQFKQTEIGEIPDGWQVRPLGEYLPKESVRNGLYKHADSYGQGTPIIRIDAFQNGEEIGLGGLKRVQVTAEERAQFATYEGDVLLNRVNSLSHLGKVGVVGKVNEPTVFESNMMCIRPPKAGHLEARFLLMLMTSDRGRTQVMDRAKRAVAQASISQQDVRSFIFAFPPVSEQKAIVRIMRTIEAQEHENELTLGQLEFLKRGLMQDLLTGRVRVPPPSEG
jgi:type I restriction enzyme, S subunit